MSLTTWLLGIIPVRVIDVFVDTLDLAQLGFSKVEAEATGRPPYAPGDLLKLYVYGYLNQVRSSRRLEREARRNLEVLWLINPGGAVVQDDCGFPQGPRQGDCRGMPGVCGVLPDTSAVWQRASGDRRHEDSARGCQPQAG